VTPPSDNPVPIDILGALTALGIDFRVTGDEAKALCPSPEHEDTTPSWSINLDSGQHHCFSCGWGGGFVFLTMTLTGKGPKESKEWIRQRKVRDVAEGKSRQQANRQTYAILTAADLWEYDYDYPEEELEYRGIDAYSALWFTLMWDHQRDGWIIPVRDTMDSLIGYQFKPRHGTNGTAINYPPNLKMVGRLFEGVDFIEGETLIVVESPLDVVRLYDMGFENVVALFGSSMDDEKAERIIEKFSKVILMLDDDNAGRMGVTRAIARLRGTDVWVFAYDQIKKAGPYYVHGPVTDKDPGNLAEADVTWGIEHATPAFRTGFQ
jgi:hypothetical protein